MKTENILLGAGAGLIALQLLKNKSAAVGAVYQQKPKAFYQCLDGTYSDHNRNRACNFHGGMISDEPSYILYNPEQLSKIKRGYKSLLQRKPQPCLPGNSSTASENLNVQDVPVQNIQLYLKKFQNRETPYSIESVQRIVDAAHNGTFRFEEFDPVLLWKAPDGNLYMLSGHSRLEAFTRLSSEGNKRFAKIPAKIISVSQAEAEEIALRSNTLSTKEKDTERAMFYRKMFEIGKSYGQILEVAKKNEGKDAVRIVSYAYLNPAGKTFTALKALESGEPGSQMIMKSIAQWIGEARLKFPMLTDRHEDEIYDWLINGAYGKQFKKKQDYLAKLATVINNRTEFGVFNQDAVLNLSNAASKSFSEARLDEMLLDKKMQIKELEKVIADKIRDYRSRGATQQQITDLLKNDDMRMRRYQLEYIELDKKRGQAIEDGAKQHSLFGIRGVRNRATNQPVIRGYMM